MEWTGRRTCETNSSEASSSAALASPGMHGMATDDFEFVRRSSGRFGAATNELLHQQRALPRVRRGFK